jgi:hypothetical protein
MAVADVLNSENDALDLLNRKFPQFGILAPGVQQEYARIALFLESREGLPREMDDLETRLTIRFKNKNGRDLGTFLREERNKTDYHLARKKLLTNELNDWELANQFNMGLDMVSSTDPVDLDRLGLADNKGHRVQQSQLPKGSVPTLTEFVDQADFRRVLLRLGYHWKDPGASPDHGEYTHRLQWYAITNAAKYGRLKLLRSPLYLFQKLALPYCWNPRYPSTDVRGQTSGRAVWDLLFDCFPMDKANNDSSAPDVGPFTNSFRCPNNVLRWLIRRDMRSRYPLLGDIMAERFEKRTGRQRYAWFDRIVKDMQENKGIAVYSNPAFRDKETYGDRHPAAGGAIYWH